MTIAPNRFKASLGAVLVLTVTLVLLIGYVAVRTFAPRLRRPIQVLWCRACNVILGLGVHTIGQPGAGARVLYAINHVSYLDIPALSSAIDATFVARADMAAWPMFGTIAKATGTIFVDRSGPRAMEQRTLIVDRLAGGEDLILFPEGTSTDGASVAPFKSALFGIIGQDEAMADVVIQPVSITYVRYADGTPLVGPLVDLYSWYGDMTLVPHLFQVLGLRGVDVEVRFHEPIHAAEVGDRKELARRCHAAVAAGVAASHAAAAGTQSTDV